MKRSFKTISKLLVVTGCVSVLAYNIANAAPLVYDVDESTPEVRTNYTTPNKIKLEGDVEFNDHGQKISLSLRDTDVQQVLRMFADKAGLNIVFHDSAKGNVTLDLVDVSLSDAFKMVLKMTNLIYTIKDKTIMVAAADQASSINMSKDNVNVLPVKYVDAAYIANFLNTNIFSMNNPGLSYGPIVTTNAETNELLIFGSDADYQMAKKIVDRFDKKPIMTTYRVNHTTPYEMAKMICETLFQLPGGSSGGGNSGSSMNSEFQMGSEPAEGKEGSIGGGTIACTVKSGVSAGSMNSYQARPTLTIYVQPDLGTLTMVGGTEQQIQMVNDFILDNDRKQPQAYLEITIVSLSESGSKDFNSTWKYSGSHLSFTGGDSQGASVPIYWHGSSTGEAGRSLTQTINWIISNKKGRILSNPKIVITNGKKSTIDLTQDYIEGTTVQVLTSSTGAMPVTQRTYEIGNDNGIKIEVLPFISPDGYVSLTIKPEYASIFQQVEDTYNEYVENTSGGTTRAQLVSVPYVAASLLQRRNLDLKNVRIKDEETLLLGGMIQEQETDTVSKIPILGDIPLIGFLFRSTGKAMEKTELLFMITPRIIKDTEDVAEL